VKGLHDLADACAGLDCDLVLVGAGPERDALAGRRQPRLHLPGWGTPAEAAQWYAAADVVALASHQEGQPLAVLEAYACGRGVVATAVGGVPDVVVPGETGWLVEARDREGLQIALKDALADPATTDAYGRAGRERVLATHSLEAAGAALVDILTLVR
jgi:glycosyltransferase involved in cell wall biosynthesis